MTRTRRSSGRLLPIVGLAAIVVAVSLLVSGGAGTDHRVSFVVNDATNLVPGLQVRAAGQTVGSLSAVDTIDGGRRARVEVKITTDKVWPLPKDTTFRGRFGGTVAYIARYVEIDRGVAKGAPFADGAVIPATNVEMPVEIDDVVDTFGPRIRANLRATLNATGAALTPAQAPLRRALDTAPPVTAGVQKVFGDLGADRTALANLVASTDQVVTAARAVGVGPLLSDTATTLQAVGSRADALRRTLAELPGTLAAARGTLRRADTTLIKATRLTSQIDPGVAELRRLTPPLNRALGTVTDIAPDAIRTVSTARRSAPAITRLLRSATRLMPDVTSTLTQAVPQLRCLRPYAPEVGGFLSTWSSFVSEGDHKDKYARLYFGTYPFPNSTPLTVPQAAKLVPSAFSNYAFPRAPGMNVNQPWFQPECGITADGNDPQKNPEAMAFDPLSRDLVSSPFPEAK